MVNGYFLRKRKVEPCNHILLWCPVVYKLRTIVYKLLGIRWVIAAWLKNEIWAWEGISKRRKIVNCIPLTTFWVVWKERNSRIFENIKEEFNKIRDRW